MRIALILLALPVLIYGSVMGYLWYEVKGRADEMLAAAAPFATIEYDSLHISPLGDEVGLNEVKIQPNMTTDEFSIDTLRLSAPHIGYFISSDNYMEQGKLPERMALEVGRLQLDLGSELFAMMEQMQGQAAAQGTAGTPILASPGAIGCGSGEPFTLSDYRKMGLGVLVVDADVALSHDETAQRGRVVVDINVEGVQQLAVTTEFDALPNLTNPGAQGKLPDVSVSYRDKGYHRLRNAYCAEMNGGTAEEYVERHIRLLSGNYGFTLPDEVAANYRRFMLKGGTLEVSMKPVQQVAPGTLGLYSATDIIEMLGLEMAIDKQPVALNRLQWAEHVAPEPESVPEPVVTAPPPSRPVPPVRTQQPPAPVVRHNTTPTFRKVSVYDAANYTNHMIKVRTADGKVREGLLQRVEDGRLYLIVRRSHGEMGFWIDEYSIRQLHVLQ